MEGSSTGRKEGFKASERYPGRYPSIPRAIPPNGENSPLPVMRWGSHHPFFCFLPPLICSSFLSLSRPAALVNTFRTKLHRKELSCKIRAGERPVSWSRRSRGSSKQHGAKSRSHSSLERSKATARARKQVLDEKNKESRSSGFDFCASNFTQADWCVQEKSARTVWSDRENWRAIPVQCMTILYIMSFDRRTALEWFFVRGHNNLRCKLCVWVVFLAHTPVSHRSRFYPGISDFSEISLCRQISKVNKMCMMCCNYMLLPKHETNNVNASSSFTDPHTVCVCVCTGGW